MVRIGVVGDTHGNKIGAREVIGAMGKIDLLLHTGDFSQDARALAKELQVPVYVVAGNGDGGSREPEEEQFQVAGWRILLVHGHRHRVKFGHLNLFYRAQEVEADLVVFGHTHELTQFTVGDIKFFNPGSAGCPDRQGQLTGSILSLGDLLEIGFVAVPEPPIYF